MRSSRRLDSSRKKDAFQRLGDESVPWDYIVAHERHLMFPTEAETLAARDGRTNPSACDNSPDLSIYPPIKPPSSSLSAKRLFFFNHTPTEEPPSSSKGSVSAARNPPSVKHTYADPPCCVFQVSSQLISPGIVLIPDREVPPITLQSVREVDSFEITTARSSPAPSDMSQVASSTATSPVASLLPVQSAAQVCSNQHTSNEASSRSPPELPLQQVSGECQHLHQPPGDPCLPPPPVPKPPLCRSSSAPSAPLHSPSPGLPQRSL